MNLKHNTLGVLIIVFGLAAMGCLIHADNVGGDFNFWWGAFGFFLIAFIVSVIKLTTYSRNTPR